MKFLPLFDRVLIKPSSQSENNSFGLLLSDVSKTRPNTGIVEAVGSGVDLDYNKCDIVVKVGDKVMFNSYAGADVEIDKEKYIVIRQIDIVGVFDERENNSKW